MDGILTLLLYGALFFVMMRFGCGSHGRHGKRGEKTVQAHQHNDTAKTIDPVCGMPVESEQGYGKMHDQQLYRFCSRNCLDKFETDPARYIQPALISPGVSA